MLWRVPSLSREISRRSRPFDSDAHPRPASFRAPKRSPPGCLPRRSRRRGSRRPPSRQAKDDSVKRDKIRRCSGRDLGVARAERRSAAHESCIKQSSASGTTCKGKHVACAMCQPLGIFELAQFVRDADQDVGVRADTVATPMPDELRSREGTVSKIGFGDRAEPGDGATGGQTPQLLVSHVGGVDQAPAPVDIAHSTAATRPGARRTSGCSPRPPLLARRHGCGSARHPPWQRLLQVLPA